MRAWMAMAAMGWGCVIDPDREAIDAIAGDWTCTGDGGHVEHLTVAVDPEEVAVEWFRQVGDDADPVVPYPTACRFVERGDAARVRNGRSLTHELRFTVREVTLVEDPLSEGDCAAFVEREQDRADAGDGISAVDYDPPEGDEMNTSLGACVR